jgi:molecular chaperone DnaK
MSEKILGIDLGTSNSAACVYIDGKATMIPSAEGTSLYGKAFPSYVAFTETGEQLVGEPAKRQASTNPDNTISEIKRHMGTDYKVNIQGKEYTPQEISAMILQKIKRDAETFLGEPVSKAVITVPAYFDDNQRTATKDAGTIAGLEVLRLVNEPTAASLAYGIDKQDEEEINILVFDLGGGTLDVTIMEFGGGVFNVLSTSGDTQLGGTDMDNALIKYLADEFEKEHGINLTKEVETNRRLREGAEKAKIELSNTVETEVNLPFIAMSNDGKPLNLIQKINRSKLESLVRPTVERCGESIDQAISDANITVDDIDKIILVGGPTRMPIVQDYVENHTGKLVERGIDPMECVSQGASIQSAVLSGEITDLILLDVTPLSLGTVVIGGITAFMIERNTTIPVKVTKDFTTAYDNQTEVICEVVQGENKMAEFNTKLGSFPLKIPPAPKGVPHIDVTFEIDANGILNVTAVDTATGNEESITITAATKMSPEEIEQKRQEAEANARENERRLKLAELKNEADSEIYSAQKFIEDPDFRNKIGEDAKDRIETLILELMDLKGSEDTVSLKLKIKELRDAVTDAGSTMY